MTTTTAARDREIVRLIRAHATIGRGTCSVIDECYSDDDLIEAFATTFTGQARTVAGAVRAAVSAHNTWAEHSADIRGYGGLDDEDEVPEEPAPTCTWMVERHPGHEVDFPSDLISECGAAWHEDDDGLGWHCDAGHSHRSDAEYYDEDEVASYRSRGLPLAPNARLMDGSEIR